MNKEKLIVVTGATGFIGSNLLYALEKDGYANIVGIDTFGTGDKWRNVAKRTHTFFVLPEQMQAYLETNATNIGAIVHLGGLSSTTVTNVDEIVKTNIQLSVSLYEFCKLHGINFIYASSASTYGDGSQGFEDNDDFAYLCKLSPLNAYGWSKWYVDKYISLDRKNSGGNTQVAGLKFFNVYGPNEYHKGHQTSVVYKFYRELIDTHVLRLFKSYREDYDDGLQLRDFVYVEDCADVIIWLLAHPIVSGLFNVGTGEARSFKDVADLTIRYSGHEADICYIDMPEQLKRHYQYHTKADMTKLKSAGYTKCMTSLEDGIKIYVKEYLKTNNIFEYEPNYI